MLSYSRQLWQWRTLSLFAEPNVVTRNFTEAYRTRFSLCFLLREVAGFCRLTVTCRKYFFTQHSYTAIPTSSFHRLTHTEPYNRSNSKTIIIRIAPCLPSSGIFLDGNFDYLCWLVKVASCWYCLRVTVTVNATRYWLCLSQSTYIGRDETGSVYLPAQLERTLQLYWWG
jgi:hypothetical protein